MTLEKIFRVKCDKIGCVTDLFYSAKHPVKFVKSDVLRIGWTYFEGKYWCPEHSQKGQDVVGRDNVRQVK